MSDGGGPRASAPGGAGRGSGAVGSTVPSGSDSGGGGGGGGGEERSGEGGTAGRPRAGDKRCEVAAPQAAHGPHDYPAAPHGRSAPIRRQVLPLLHTSAASPCGLSDYLRRTEEWSVV